MHYLSRGRLLLIFALCFAGLWFAAANFIPQKALDRLPGFFYKEQISLGLDLQGGSSILLGVDLKNIVKDYMGSLLDEMRRVFRKERIGYMNLRLENLDSIKFTLRNVSQKEKALQLVHQMLPDIAIEVKDNQDITVRVSTAAFKKREEGAVKQSIEIVRRRIDEMGTKEPSIQQQGENRILVQLPGVGDPAQVREILGRTARLTFRLLHPSAYYQGKGSIPYGYEVLPGDTGHGEHVVPVQYLVQKKIDVSGEMLVDAQPTVDQNGTNAVSFSLDAGGARRFADVTAKNVGRPFAIILDEKVISAPVINSPIPGGQGIITGSFSLDESRNLAILLRAGALPAPLTVLEEKVVGPELGSDSIKAGQLATILAVVLITIFMFVFYGPLFGGIANFCLLFNLIFLLGCMTVLGATLTLPGIAGIALTLGMAVDANILVFERIREEIQHHQAPLSAIGAGYDRAMATIIDSNITTIIGAILLYIFGNGPVRGFAVTLTAGILISMFTAISLSRIFVLTWLKYFGHKRPLPI